MNRVIFLLCVLLGRSSAIIYELNDTEYAKMPAVYRMDPYDECFIQPGGMYCTVDFTLVSDEPSPLMDMIRGYSEVTSKHFNHSKLTYGICVTSSCTESNSTDLRLKLESCLNDSMWREYRLKTKVPDKFYCDGEETKWVITPTDFAVAGVILCLLLLNFIGSFYDFIANPEKDGVRFLLCFSIRRNWRRLVAPAADGPEPRLKRLKSLNGLKTIVMFLIIMAHSMIINGYFINNTAYYERSYDNLGYHIILNGTVIVQTFFIISGFLLAYNLQLYAEKRKLNGLVIIKTIIIRWLRLTPTYAVVLAFATTWYRHLGRGPIWQKVVGTEVADCQQTWWLHLLYVNNYVAGSECMAHTWYLATDTQLYLLGVIVCVACSSTRSRAVVLSLLFAIGVAIPTAITYYKDLDGILMPSPEAFRGFYVHDPTYIEVYSPGHTNIPCYILGLALGYIVHHAQSVGFDPQKYQKYRFVIWLTLPLGIIVVMSGRVFYLDSPRAALIERVAAAALTKPIIGFLIAICIASFAFKIENSYRGLLEWRGWTSLARVSYCAYLFHYPYVKYFLGGQVSLLHINFMFACVIFLGTIFISYLAAFLIWLLIEAPLGQVAKMCYTRAEKNTETSQVDGKPVFTSYDTRLNVQ